LNLPPAELYPRKLAPLVKPGGFFLITSCNFTEEEVRARFEGAGVGACQLPSTGSCAGICGLTDSVASAGSRLHLPVRRPSSPDRMNQP
jgi:hypothetical protein